MRLLEFGPAANDSELSITLCDLQVEVPPYAILSHRWGHARDEVSFSEFGQDGARLKAGYKKIEFCCRQALKDGLTYAWVDTCCINKESSAELSEAINSMYSWYRDSEACYVYLDDVVHNDDYSAPASTFRNSQWFTRGWTLQELIAPSKVVFLDSEWTEIGRKGQPQMAQVVSEITGVPKAILLENNDRMRLTNICASQILYWASRRQTSRVEDRAYSLLGLFNISLPILYGEGYRSFRRLQEEIIRSRFDHSIFAWNLTESYSGLLAEFPDAFSQSGNVRMMPFERYSYIFNFRKGRFDYTSTNLGIEVKFPYQKSESHLSFFVICLACYYIDTGKEVLIYLRRLARPTDHYLRARISTGSLCDGDKIYKFFSSWKLDDPNFRVIAPEQLGQKVILPPLPNDVATQQNVSKKEDINCYQIYLTSPDPIISVVPMPHELEQSKVTIETEAETVWVVLIAHSKSHQVKMYLVVIDGEILYHFEAVGEVDYNDILGTDQRLSSDESYMNWRSFVGDPCTHLFFGSDKMSEDGEAIIDDNTIRARVDKIIVIFIENPPRKFFHLVVEVVSLERLKRGF